MREPMTMEKPSQQYAYRLLGKLFVTGSTKPAVALAIRTQHALIGKRARRVLQSGCMMSDMETPAPGMKLLMKLAMANSVPEASKKSTASRNTRHPQG